MKKIIAIIMSCVLLLSFAACTDNNNTNLATENNTESTGSEVPELSGDSKTLIVYFSHSNNTHKLAEIIKGKIGADSIRLTPAQPYEEDTLFDRAQNELNDGTRPEISNLPDAETIEQYDTILVGFPIWWYDLPMPMWTFLEEYDLSEKTIIPFFTHKGSSNGAGSIETIEKLCPNSTVLTENALSVRGSDVENSESQVTEWLTEIGLK